MQVSIVTWSPFRSLLHFVLTLLAAFSLLCGAASAQQPGAAQATTSDGIHMADGSVWKVASGGMLRVSPQPEIDIRLTMHKIGIGCVAGNSDFSEKNRPAYVPPPYLAASKEVVRPDVSGASVCLDAAPGTVLLGQLLWRGTRSDADAASFRAALTSILTLIKADVAAPAGPTPLRLYDPEQLVVLTDAQTGDWAVDQQNASVALVTLVWPATLRVVMRLELSAPGHKCEDLGLPASAGKYLWSPFGYSAVSADGLMMTTCQQNGSRVVMAQIQEAPGAEGGELSAVVDDAADAVKRIRAMLEHVDRALNGSVLEKSLPLTGHTQMLYGAAFSPDARRVLTCSNDHTARIWNAATGQAQATLKGHTDTVWSAVFSPDGQRVLTQGLDTTVRVWNAVNGQLLFTLQGQTGEVRSAAFSPDSQRIVTASADKTARIWNATSGQLLITLQGHTEAVRSAVFSPDGLRILTAGSDNTARIWNAANGQLLTTLQPYTAPEAPKSGGIFSPFGQMERPRNLHGAIFSPDGQLVLAMGGESAQVWSAADGRLLFSMEGEGTVRGEFSPDGKRVVTSGEKQEEEVAKIWDVASGKLLATLYGNRGGITTAVFSPDGRYVLTAGKDGAARIWSATQLSAAASGQLLLTLQTYEAELHTAAFSPDGKRVVTAGWENSARIWDLEPAATPPSHASQASPKKSPPPR